MFKIVKVNHLNAMVTQMEIEAPLVARKTQAGQFAMLRLDETGERVPLTICDFNRETGTISFVFQHAGATTMKLGMKKEGEYLADVVGPLGIATKLHSGMKRIAVVGGGVGCADTYPIALEARKLGIEVDNFAGFRNKDMVVLEDEMRAVSTNLYLTTDDGSYGEKGFVTDKLRSILETGREYDEVITIAPIIAMKFVSATTKPFGVKTLCALNPLMVDGTGMCGCCRVTVDGVTRFVCVEGPEFDGHLVDWDELLKRTMFYREQEQEKADHVCRLKAKIAELGGAN